jgi:hypothetical protein
MSIGSSRFNIYLLLLIAATFCGGCQWFRHYQEKSVATLRVHLEVTPDSTSFSTAVPVYRAKPVTVNVDKSPFLTEAEVSEAKLVESTNGFALQIQFDRRGTWLLETYTTSNPGRHFAIFSAFGKGMKQSRWLGAPILSGRISNGVLTFTPDATRDEAEQFVLGLNAVAKKIQKKLKW